MNFFKKIIASARWVHAIDLAAKHDYKRAHEVLVRINPQYSGSAEYFLLKGVLEVLLEDYLSSVADLKKAKKLAANSSVYNEDEKRYLLVFANNLLPPSKRNDDLSFEEERILRTVSFDIARVSMHLRKKFPMRE